MAAVAEQLNAALSGRYRIERELEPGGMAKVFLAQDLRLRCPVAIKVLDPELAAVNGTERFLREIETVAGLIHPHILPLRDSGFAGDLPYYVMPYVEGSSLRERLKREGQLSVKDALRLVGQVASALDFAHRRDVVHRDIKPENILLVDGQAVVADFGIARQIGPAAATRLTEHGVPIGTPAYMSPEQWTGDATLDGRSDIYSLGCVLYELLAGQPPFTGTTVDSLRHQHQTVAPRPVSALRSKIKKGGAVDRALETALAKASADRQATAAEFAAAVTAIDAKPPSAIAAALVIAIVGGILLRPLISDLIEKLVPDNLPPTGKRALVLVAEFDGPAADSSLVSATRDLAAAALEQSKIVAVVPDDQVAVALERAGKPASTRVDAQVARELDGSVATPVTSVVRK